MNWRKLKWDGLRQDTNRLASRRDERRSNAAGWLVLGAVTIGGATAAARWMAQQSRQRAADAERLLPVSERAPHLSEERANAVTSETPLFVADALPAPSVSPVTAPAIAETALPAVLPYVTSDTPSVPVSNPTPAARAEVEPSTPPVVEAMIAPLIETLAVPEPSLSPHIDPIHDMPAPERVAITAEAGTTDEREGAKQGRSGSEGNAGKRGRSYAARGGNAKGNPKMSMNDAPAQTSDLIAQSESKMGAGEELRDREFSISEESSRMSTPPAMLDANNIPQNTHNDTPKETLPGDKAQNGDVESVFEQREATPDFAAQTR